MPPKKKIPKEAKQYYDMDDSSLSDVSTPEKEQKPKKKRAMKWSTHAELETQARTLRKKLRDLKSAIQLQANALYTSSQSLEALTKF
jgi:hypothetical protein